MAAPATRAPHAPLSGESCLHDGSRSIGRAWHDGQFVPVCASHAVEYAGHADHAPVAVPLPRQAS